MGAITPTRAGAAHHMTERAECSRAEKEKEVRKVAQEALSSDDPQPYRTASLEETYKACEKDLTNCTRKGLEKLLQRENEKLFFETDSEFCMPHVAGTSGDDEDPQ